MPQREIEFFTLLAFQRIFFERNDCMLILEENELIEFGNAIHSPFARENSGFSFYHLPFPKFQQSTKFYLFVYMILIEENRASDFRRSFDW